MKLYDKVKLINHVFMDVPYTCDEDHLAFGETGTVTAIAVSAVHKSGVKVTIRLDRDKRERTICSSSIELQSEES